MIDISEKQYWRNARIEDAEKRINIDAECIHKKDENGYTPMHYVVMSTKVDIKILDLLISKGGDINAKTLYGCTPLWLCAEYGSYLAALKLIDNGADVNIYAEKKITPLMTAVSNRNARVLQSLIDANANLNTQDDKKSNTALHLACSHQTGRDFSKNCVRLLVEAGADLNIVNCAGWTPLHYLATELGTYDSIKLYVKAGANLNIKDCQCETPYDLAKRYSRFDSILELLKGDKNVYKNKQ